jgi:hypothetical protein
MIHIKNGKAIVYHDPALGRTVICYPMYDWKRPNETEDQFVQRVIAKDVPKSATDVRIVNAADIPYDPARRDRLRPDLTYDESQRPIRG